ncbi:helix-turn-helix domain-containing protein [Zavarzinella formosa]|uniref:helix-turn-helix domain-containing protein n=1 Tax=Zavarzinella formosa TaxID=360055 RepID=UPI0003042653|nr:helix-turn-helix transcriptional regulator [Zavarzinella formosa]
MTRPAFAKQLRKSRSKAKMSQSELARMTGINRTVINRYEAGRSTPEIENLVLLADTLDVSVDVLLGRKAWLAKRGHKP